MKCRTWRLFSLLQINSSKTIARPRKTCGSEMCQPPPRPGLSTGPCVKIGGYVSIFEDL